MIIANPIYDTMFKRLMDDLPTAKFFIETLIDEKVEDLSIKPQEYRYEAKSKDQTKFDEAYKLLTVYKLDYIATIKTATGEHKKVLIEVQKVRNRIDVMRFRTYLAEQYKLEDEVVTAYGKETMPLPIITIYLLGFNLSNIESAAIKVERQYIDLILGHVIHKKNEFVALLTHNSYIVQLQRINSKLQNRIDELLSVFEQKNFVDERGTIKDYNYEIKTPAVKRIIDSLEREGANPERRKEIEDEIEAWKIIEGGNRQEFERLRYKIEEKDRALLEKEKALEDVQKALELKEKELEELRRRFVGK